MALYRSYDDEQLARTKDVDIFPILKERGFTAIITQDRRQLFYSDEREGLRVAGLHWVGLTDIQGKGIRFHAQLLSVLASAMPDIVGAAYDAPHAFYVSPDNRATRPISVERI